LAFSASLFEKRYQRLASATAVFVINGMKMRRIGRTHMPLFPIW
jgi:hypothetical protein